MQRGPPTWNDERQATGGLSPVVSRAYSEAVRVAAESNPASRNTQVGPAHDGNGLGSAAPRRPRPAVEATSVEPDKQLNAGSARVVIIGSRK